MISQNKLEKLRYLFVGGVNTIFGFIVSIVLYELLAPKVNVFFISIFGNLINITFSFMTYKFFVFRSPGSWWRQYFRAWATYGFSAALSVLLTWFFVDMFGVKFALSQVIIIGLGVIISYAMHKNFTFRAVSNG